MQIPPSPKRQVVGNRIAAKKKHRNETKITITGQQKLLGLMQVHFARSPIGKNVQENLKKCSKSLIKYIYEENLLF